MGPLAPFWRADLSLSTTQIGGFTFFFFVGTSMSSLYFGYLADRWGIKRSLTLGLGIMSSALILASRASTFWGCCLFIWLAGVGYGTVNPSTNKVIARTFSKDFRGLAISLKQTGVTIGASLGAATLPIIAVAIGWRNALALVGLLVGIPIVASRNWHGDEFLPEPSTAPEKGNRGVFSIGVIMLSILACGFSAAQSSVTTHMTLYLTEAFTVPVVIAGQVSSLVQIAGTGGRLLWGVVSDRMLRGRRQPLLSVLGFASAGVCYYLGKATPTSYTHLFLASFVLGMSILGWNPLFQTLLAESVEPKFIGTVTGFGLMINFIGISCGPLLFGYLVDVYGSYAVGWQYMAFMVLLLGVLSFWIPIESRK